MSITTAAIILGGMCAFAAIALHAQAKLHESRLQLMLSRQRKLHREQMDRMKKYWSQLN